MTDFKSLIEEKARLEQRIPKLRHDLANAEARLTAVTQSLQEEEREYRDRQEKNQATLRSKMNTGK